MPLYATAVGLLVSSGVYASPRIMEQKLFDSPEEIAPKKEETTTTKPKSTTKKSRVVKESGYITGDLFGSLKKSIAGIFDERDMEM